MRYFRLFVFILGLNALSFGSSPLFAQENGSLALDSLANRLEAVDQQVRILARKMELEQEAAAAKKKETPSIAATADGFSFKSADGNYMLKVRAHTHSDGRFFLGDDVKVATNTFLIRRQRFLFEGTVAKIYDFKFMPDFGGGQFVLQDAYLDARFLPYLKLRAGKMKTPFGIERLQSPLYISFIERGLPNNLVPNRDVGAQVHGDLAGGVINYMIGAFNGVADAGSGDRDTFDSKDYAARLFVQPFLKSQGGALRGLGIGVAVTSGTQTGTVTTPSLPSYVSPGQIAFFRYRTDGTAAGTVFADGKISRLSPQAYYSWSRFSLLGEYVTSSQNVTRATTSAKLENKASQAIATYVLTGENATYRGVTPKKSFEPAAGTWGAFELTARVSKLDVDDDAFPVFANPQSSASEANAWAVGLNWYMNKNIKFVVNYEQTSFKGGAATGDRLDEKAILSRFQITY